MASPSSDRGSGTGTMPGFLRSFTLSRILILALAVRLLPAFFSQGYAMIDDHFLIVEVAQSWAEGHDLFEWLPDRTKGISEPKEHTLFYTGVTAGLFRTMQAAHITGPQAKMLLIRLLHALYSLLVVYYGYLIARQLAGEEAAIYTGLLLSLLWFMPILSVRNLVEMVCVAPVLAAIWRLMRDEKGLLSAFIAGFIIGFAFDIRFQAALFIGGIGLALLYQRRWLQAIVFGIGTVVNVAIFQLSVDVYFWGYPGAQFLAYFKYNVAYAGGFVQGHWFNYLLLIAGLVLPPVSLLFLFGTFRRIRERLILFLPALIFFVFHSSFINKQERFILPVVPLFVILGCTGWYVYQRSSPWWRSHAVFQSRLIWFAAVLNLILLLPVSVASTKTSKMDAMTWLYHRGDDHTFIVEAADAATFEIMPRYYLGHWSPYYTIRAGMTAAQLRESLRDTMVKPNYVIFLSDRDLDTRLTAFRRDYAEIELQTAISPSWLDRLFHWLNPANKNEPCYIYRIKG